MKKKREILIWALVLPVLAVQFSAAQASGETFLVPGAAGREEAYSAYTALLQKSGYLK